MTSAQDVSRLGAFSTTVAYVAQFYPLWFTYNQSRFATHNRLVGPDKVTPLYHIVVAINVDTLYTSTFLQLESEPVVLTIPETTVSYSMLTLDPYCDIFQTSIPAGTPGTYALVGPGGYSGTLPENVTAVEMPLNFCVLIFRADKYSSTGEDTMDEAEAFRKSLRIQTLSAYESDPTGGNGLVIPEVAFAIPYKTIADNVVKINPINFLRQLQTAVASSNTPTLSPEAQALSDRFDSLFGDGSAKHDEFAAGAQAGHKLIVDNYLSNTGKTNWINFTNIGAWGDNVVDRSSITEFIQYGNGYPTAAYFHAFKDYDGAPLDGNNGEGYVLTFRPDKIPAAKRFWSLTAYTPNSIELIENSADVYDVASYTPGLVTDRDGSISIYIAKERPQNAPEANWLPVSNRRFNLMLRVYGPEGNVLDQTYVPPGIRRKKV